MHAIIYKFNVIEDHENDFEIAWEKLTKAFMTYSGGLGSRLHKDSEGNYIAYAQWPDRETWKKAGSKLPENTKKWVKAMKDSSDGTEILHQMDVMNDLLIIK
ncbi:antibiotic biosynthesis monooxygenase [Maribacter sp. MMG018]|uniref:antibiotic biosynthesis monooxygenase family protein n=1 Tax=Maribacter sp. MMG018 TaxID=2822688 RepID=UPI001B376A1C|nr:antibiotic biosynthesis monooxygenase [Maribacter sp. MMG018]MBQ4915849.1 antibiotic biosynthesis monooxygenase [Maribacter sp. MMG018]